MHQVIFGIAGHFHRIGIERVIVEEPFKNVIQAVAQNIIQQDHRLASARCLRRQINEAWDFVGRYLQQRIVDGVAADNLHRQIGVIIF